MSWEEAMDRAVAMSRLTRRRWSVYGVPSLLGGWRYGLQLARSQRSRGPNRVFR